MAVIDMPPEGNTAKATAGDNPARGRSGVCGCLPTAGTLNKPRGDFQGWISTTSANQVGRRTRIRPWGISLPAFGQSLKGQAMAHLEGRDPCLLNLLADRALEEEAIFLAPMAGVCSTRARGARPMIPAALHVRYKNMPSAAFQQSAGGLELTVGSKGIPRIHQDSGSCDWGVGCWQLLVSLGLSAGAVFKPGGYGARDWPRV